MDFTTGEIVGKRHRFIAFAIDGPAHRGRRIDSTGSARKTLGRPCYVARNRKTSGKI